MLTASCVIVLQFHCCGVDDDGYKLYLQNNSSNDTFPPSCCKNETACPKTVGEAKKEKSKVFKSQVSISLQCAVAEKIPCTSTF